MCQRLSGPSLQVPGKKLLGDTNSWEPSASLILNACTASEFSGRSGADRFFLAALHAALSFGRPEGAQLLPVRATVWISTPTALCSTHCFCPCSLPGSAGWLGLGPWANISPRVQFFSLSFSVSLVRWVVSSYPGLCFCKDLSFNQNESWCRILFVPRENSRGHL